MSLVLPEQNMIHDGTLPHINKQIGEKGGGERASVNVFTSLALCQSARHRNTPVYFAISEISKLTLVRCGSLTSRGRCIGDLGPGIAE